MVLVFNRAMHYLTNHPRPEGSIPGCVVEHEKSKLELNDCALCI